LLAFLFGRALGWFTLVFNLLMNDLTPLIPLSFEGEGEGFVKRG